MIKETKDDAGDMKLIKGFKCRSFPIGEGEDGWGLMTSEQNVERSVATEAE